jgi:hypothetical protein
MSRFYAMGAGLEACTTKEGVPFLSGGVYTLPIVRGRWSSPEPLLSKLITPDGLVPAGDVHTKMTPAGIARCRGFLLARA